MDLRRFKDLLKNVNYDKLYSYRKLLSGKLKEDAFRMGVMRHKYLPPGFILQRNACSNLKFSLDKCLHLDAPFSLSGKKAAGSAVFNI